MVKWSDILDKAGVEIKLTEQAEGEEESTEDKPVVEKKAVTKSVTPKAAAIKSGPAKKINTPRKMA
jgi:hypothetical protein